VVRIPGNHTPPTAGRHSNIVLRRLTVLPDDASDRRPAKEEGGSSQHPRQSFKSHGREQALQLPQELPDEIGVTVDGLDYLDQADRDSGHYSLCVTRDLAYARRSRELARVKATEKRRVRVYRGVTVLAALLLFVTLDLVAGTLRIPRARTSFRCWHPYYHHGLLPNQNRTTEWGPRRYSMITNSAGFRDGRPRIVSKAPTKSRVVLMGDSFIEGMGVEYQESVAGLLEQRWSADGIEVLNAGVLSYSPKLYNLKTRYLVEQERLEFHELIVFIDVSDVQDELYYEDFSPAMRDRLFARIGRWFLRHSLTGQLLVARVFPETRIDNAFRPVAADHEWVKRSRIRDALGENPGEQGDRWKWTVRDDLFEQWARRGLGLAREQMTSLTNFCNEKGIELVVVVYPSPIQIFANDLDSRQVAFWREFCDEAGLRFVNLFPAFIDRSAPGPDVVYGRYFIRADMHWNEAGHRLVADEVARSLGSDSG
jgi:lysophospholipase L1-like esterase